MPRFTLAVPAVLLLLVACPVVGEVASGSGSDSDSGSDSGADDAPTEGPAPFRDQWRVVHEGPFGGLDADGYPTISSLIIGNSLGYADNFVNRGDVIVEFDGEPGTIRVELRRFTFAPSQADAQEVFDRLSLWAYNSSINAPKRPADMDEADRCGGVDGGGAPLPWQDGCAVYVYYEGQIQLQRAGADIRVTLGPDYLGALSVATSDNVVDDTYPNRGNVCVDGLMGEVQVELQSGIALVSVASDTAYPTCPPDLVADCETFDDPGTEGADAWAADCGCINQGYSPGLVRVESLAPSATDITVDVPAGMWTNFRAENAGENALLGKHCVATIEGLGAVEFGDGMADPNKPWLRGGIANRPSAAPPGGFRVDLASSGCESVASVESPADWDADVDDPASSLRGNVEVCEGCLQGKRCDELLPGD
jgi:hypothetical protein